MSGPTWSVDPGLGVREPDGIVVVEGGYMVENMVGIAVECNRTAWLGVVIEIVVDGSLLGMAWFDVWEGRLALRGIAWMDLV